MLVTMVATYIIMTEHFTDVRREILHLGDNH